MDDFHFQRGRKKSRGESRRRSLFRTPPRLRPDEDDASPASLADDQPARALISPQEVMQQASPIVGESPAGDDTAPDSGGKREREREAASDGTHKKLKPGSAAKSGIPVRGKGRSSSTSSRGSSGGSDTAACTPAEATQAPPPLPHECIPDGLPDKLRMQKLLEISVERSVLGIQALAPEDVMEPVRTVARSFTSELEDILCQGMQQATADPCSNACAIYQRRINSLTTTLQKIDKEVSEWENAAEEAEKLEADAATAAAQQPEESGDMATLDAADAEIAQMLPAVVKSTTETMTLQADTLASMVQQAQFALETSKGEHAAQVKRVAAMTFGVAHVSAGKGAGPSAADPRALLRKLAEVGTARDKENSL